MRPRVIRLIVGVGTYFPLALMVVLLFLTSIARGVLQYVPLGLMVAVCALSFIMIAAHLESRLTAVGAKLEELSSHMEFLRDAYETQLETAAPVIRTMSLADGFVAVSKHQVHWQNLRVLAVSTQQILTFFSSHQLSVDNCELLLRGFDPGDKNTRALAQQTLSYVQGWRLLEREGRIGRLVIRSYDFLPTEFQCVFDEDLLLLGIYEPNPGEPIGLRVGKVSLVESGTLRGREVIRQYRDRFDKFFDVCATHYGPNSYHDAVAGQAT